MLHCDESSAAVKPTWGLGAVSTVYYFALGSSSRWRRGKIKDTGGAILKGKGENSEAAFLPGEDALH